MIWTITQPSRKTVTSMETPPTPAPSVHVRAVITWLAIFPMVAIGMVAMAPFVGHWPLVLRALALTAVVVPLAVYLVVPRMLAAHHRFFRRSK